MVCYIRSESAALTEGLPKSATQTVFGEGQPNAETVFVGEQPGDKEDLQGRPFS
jgi:uracil-DNA glycosylase family 4